jgi:methionine synthase II (cobalamin-independent)
MKKRIQQAAETIASGNPPRSKEEALNQYVHMLDLISRTQTDRCYLHRICISPQCGFASHSEGNPVTEEDVVKKLSLVSKIAADVWA